MVVMIGGDGLHQKIAAAHGEIRVILRVVLHACGIEGRENDGVVFRIRRLRHPRQDRQEQDRDQEQGKNSFFHVGFLLSDL